MVEREFCWYVRSIVSVYYYGWSGRDVHWNQVRGWLIGGRLFKIIEDESVPRGTVRFEPDLLGIKIFTDPERPIERIADHNVYVNPLDFYPTVYNSRFLLTVERGTLHLEAT